MAASCQNPCAEPERKYGRDPMAVAGSQKPTGTDYEKRERLEKGGRKKTRGLTTNDTNFTNGELNNQSERQETQENKKGEREFDGIYRIKQNGEEEGRDNVSRGGARQARGDAVGFVACRAECAAENGVPLSRCALGPVVDRTRWRRENHCTAVATGRIHP